MENSMYVYLQISKHQWLFVLYIYLKNETLKKQIKQNNRQDLGTKRRKELLIC